jgi:hypothetical protein
VRSTEDAVPDIALVNLREGQALSQEEVVDKLNVIALEKTGHVEYYRHDVSRFACLIRGGRCVLF